MTLWDRLRKAPVLARVAAVVVLVECGVAGAFYSFERGLLWAERNDVSHPTAPPPEHEWRQYEVPPVRLPTVVPAGGAGLSDDDVVVGVEAGGKARAYRLDVLRDRRRHVVNDMVGGVPVSVAYCDLTDCVRAYTDSLGSKPLDVKLGGLYDREMVIKADGSLYLHKSNTPFRSGTIPFPYELLTPERMTWREWKERHPTTDVYVGEGP